MFAFDYTDILGVVSQIGPAVAAILSIAILIQLIRFKSARLPIILCVTGFLLSLAEIAIIISWISAWR